MELFNFYNLSLTMFILSLPLEQAKVQLLALG